MNLFLLILIFINVKARILLIDKVVNETKFYINYLQTFKYPMEWPEFINNTFFIFKNVNLTEYNLFEDTIIGDNQFNNLDISFLISDNITFKNDYLYDTNKQLFKIENINSEINGRKMKPDHVYVKCNTIYFINLQGSFDSNHMDLIQIEEASNPLCKFQLSLHLYPFTNVINHAKNGSFFYYVYNDVYNFDQTTLIEIDMKFNSTDLYHKIIFDIYRFYDIENMNIKNKTEIIIEFKTKQKIKILFNQNQQKIEYSFMDGTFKKNENNIYQFFYYPNYNNAIKLYTKMSKTYNISINPD